MIAQRSIWQNRYYRVPRMYMTWVGLWPYQPIGSRCLHFVLTFTFSFSIIIPQVLYLVLVSTEVNDLFDCVPSIAVTLVFSLKLMNVMINDKKIRACFKTIEEDWLSLNTDVEKGILQRHAEYGRYLSTFYAIFMLMMSFFYVIKPFIVMLMKDDSMEQTESSMSEAMKLPFHVAYGEKLDQYFYAMMIHCYAAILAHHLCIIAIDSFYFTLIQHACGMFSIIGHMLENIGNDDANFRLKLDRIKDDDYSKALNCLRRHLHVLEFAKLIESTFTNVFLISVNLNMVVGSICGIQVVMNLGKAGDIVAPLALYFAQLTHLFVQFWQAQFLLDYSNIPYESMLEGASFSVYTCKGKWYHTSGRCRKILLLIMSRTASPCKITAGKIVTLSIESFSAVLKTSVSCFTVLRSFQ